MLNIYHKVNSLSTIVKECLNDIFKLKDSIFIKNPGAHFRDLEPMLAVAKVKMFLRQLSWRFL